MRKSGYLQLDNAFFFLDRNCFPLLCGFSFFWIVVLFAPNRYKILYCPVLIRTRLVRTHRLNQTDAMQRAILGLVVGRLNNGAVVIIREVFAWMREQHLVDFGMQTPWRTFQGEGFSRGEFEADEMAFWRDEFAHAFCPFGTEFGGKSA